MRLVLVALFPLSFTTSSDVFCLKFGRVWEMLWIFSCEMDMWQMCKTKQKPYFYSVSNGVGASSLWDWTANLVQLLTVGTLTNSHCHRASSLEIQIGNFAKLVTPRAPKNLTFRYRQFWLGIFLKLLFFMKKIKACWITRTMYSQTGKNTKWAETIV